MKKLALNMIVFGAMAGITQAQHSVGCDGAESTGTGIVSCDATPRDYAYPVTADAATAVGVVLIGTDDCVEALYTNVCMPAGWSFNVAVVLTPIAADVVKTAHGAATNSTPPGGSRCQVSFAFNGAARIAPGQSFTFGFDHPSPSHDVGWTALTAGVGGSAASETFGSPSGDGVGPVHGPNDSGIPAVSEWGLIAMTLLVLVAGTLVLRRSRRVAA